jgi:D-glycero-alpha-D-manno-heptose-7-phosphate kinase
MIITRTPYRISFCGGGTDLRSFYKKSYGSVISTSIDKYLYVVVRKQIGLVEFKYRINYSTVEFCKSVDEIKHPIVKEALIFFGIDYPLEITTFADIPASTGLGSSSAFAVGLIYALAGLEGKLMTKYEVATLAAKIEIDFLGRNIGKQDHFASAYGGLNVFKFYKNEKVEIEPVICAEDKFLNFQDSLMIFYTGLKRDASDILAKQIVSLEKKRSAMIKMRDQVEGLRKILAGQEKLSNAGSLFSKGWNLKKSIAKEISTNIIDDIYEKGIKAGALGGKILGAGGGGFLLFFVETEKKANVRNALKEYFEVPFRFDTSGCRITYFDRGI